MKKFGCGITALAFLLLLAAVITAGCTSPTDTGNKLIPPPQADISGTWFSTESTQLYGDSDFISADIISTIDIEQHGRVFYISGSVVGGTGVGVFSNEEGTTFLSDISTDTYRGLICGESRGDELWLSYTGMFTKNFSKFKRGDVFAETYRYVRGEKKPENTFEFKPLKESYPFSNGFVISKTEKYELSGEKFTVERQQSGIISGTVENNAKGKQTRVNYIGAASFIDVDPNGVECEYYIVIDQAGRFWILGNFPDTENVMMMSVNIGAYPGVEGDVVSEFGLYGEDTGYSADAFNVTPISLLGEWEGIAAKKIKADKVEEEFYPGSAEALNQADIMFAGIFTSQNVPSIDVGGALLSPTSNELFIAGPKAADANSVFIVRGWVEGDMMYACGIYESFGVKTATFEVFKRNNG